MFLVKLAFEVSAWKWKTFFKQFWLRYAKDVLQVFIVILIITLSGFAMVVYIQIWKSRLHLLMVLEPWFSLLWHAVEIKCSKVEGVFNSVMPTKYVFYSM